MGRESVLGIAQIPIRATLDGLDKDLSAARGKVESSIGRIVGGVQALGAATLTGLGMATGAALALAGALAKITIDAAQVEGLRMAFEGLAASSGKSADELLAGLEKGSAGMVAQRDLMKSYNLAAQLVSTTFADQLPDAMTYLSKVAAATGQDMGYLLDSWVRGIGRLSPMILDNLGIQVSLEEATARASAMYGVAADQLSKEQVQAGMTAVALEKLEQNTAAMPDVTGSAAAGMARMRATFQNVKDQIGMAFLPTLQSLMQTFGTLLSRVLPPVVTFMENVVAPAFETAAFFIDSFVAGILAGQSPIDALTGALRDIGLDQVADTIAWVADELGKLWEQIGPIVEAVMEWIGENVKLQDILIALGIAIATVVVPAIYSALAAILPVVAPIVAAFVGLVAAAAILRTAWETDFLGIRTFVTDTFETIRAWLEENWPTIQETILTVVENVKAWFDENWPVIQQTVMTVFEAIKAWIDENWPTIQENILTAVEQVRAWFVENWPVIQAAVESAGEAIGAAVQKLTQLWNDYLLPVVAIVADFLLTVLVPAMQNLVETGMMVLGSAITALTALWQNIMYPVLVIVWDFVQNSIFPLFVALSDLLEAVVGKAVEALAGLWQNMLKPALQAVWQFISDKVEPIFKALVITFNASVNPVLKDLGEKILPVIKGAFDAVGRAVEKVIGWINDLADKIRNMELPDWLTPGSPTPFELGLRGIADALQDVERLAGRSFAAFEMARLELGGQMLAEGQLGGQGGTDARQFNVTIEGMEPQDVLPAVGAMQALWGMG